MVQSRSQQKLKKPRNYLARREQWRLLGLVLSLGLVAVAMMEIRKPENRRWFAVFVGGGGAAQPPAAGEPIDNRIARRIADDDVPGSFVSPAPLNGEVDTSGRYFPGVKSGYFEAIRDDTYFRNDERHSWFNLLEVLGQTDQQRLRKASTGRASYAQLFKQSKEFRGELVTVRGLIRRANPLGVPKNHIGLKRYFRLWLFPEDNASSPVIVYCLNLPEDFPTGMQFVAEAEVTGFFFKRWAYNAWNPNLEQNVLRTAPTLLAKTVDWEKPPEKVAAEPPGLGSILAVIAAAVALGTFLAVYVYRRTRLTPPDVPDALPGIDRLREADATPGAATPTAGSAETGDES